ncbi:hypothetical protein SNE40_014349 [Patella caerulea]|uniref:Ig-like domain-containing protein n=1 Tax=Patella caerulea TaxID=87958 RepID=A0AAN8PCQ3_PATCE
MLIKSQGNNLLTIIVCIVVTSYCLEVSSNHDPKPGTCPEKCDCGRHLIYLLENQVYIVNCSGVGYVDIPSGLPSKTDALLLTDNNFHNLSHLGPLPNLQLLDLSHNVIQYIDNHWLFEYLPNLHILRLSNNAVRELKHGSFSGLKNLQCLDLSHNILQHVELHAFGGLNHLARLYLDHNKLTDLDRSWFLSMSLLYEVYLSHNLISRLEANGFDMLSQVVHLDLSNNIIKTINSDTFAGLNNLKVLDLSKNKLTSFPADCFQKLPYSEKLILDSNPITRLKTKDISDLNISVLSLSYMHLLRVTESKAFYNLSKLVSLKLHDNPAFLYVNPTAFYNVPHLEKLYLHNNGLMGISPQIQISLPNIKELHLYQNPLHCDCNIYWIKKQLVSGEIHNKSTIFTDSDKLVCDSPDTNINVPLRQVPLPSLSPLCPPTTLPLFQDHYNLSIGQTLSLECKALGVPSPDLVWLLPNGQLNTSAHDKRIVIKEPTLITLKGVLQSDSGTYACKASNVLGFDISSTAVNVANKDLKIVPIGIFGDYITVAWRGTIPRLNLDDFQLNYHTKTSTDQPQKIHLHKLLHRYTITGLKPMTTYEVCLTYLDQYLVHCQNITTNQKTVIKLGITRITNTHIIVGITTFIGSVLTLILIGYLWKKFYTKKGYIDPEGKTHDHMSPIPLENLFQPQSTPLCSSRTALLPNSQI